MVKQGGMLIGLIIGSFLFFILLFNPFGTTGSLTFVDSLKNAWFGIGISFQIGILAVIFIVLLALIVGKEK